MNLKILRCGRPSTGNFPKPCRTLKPKMLPLKSESRAQQKLQTLGPTPNTPDLATFAGQYSDIIPSRKLAGLCVDRFESLWRAVGLSGRGLEISGRVLRDVDQHVLCCVGLGIKAEGRLCSKKHKTDFTPLGPKQSCSLLQGHSCCCCC